MFNNLRKDNGITLIVLAATIGIITTLVLVTFSMITNGKGGIKQATEAKKANDRIERIEQEQQDNISGYMDDFVAGYNQDKGCNSPKLTTGMKPVNYNTSKKIWEECDTDEWQWDYKAQTSTTESGGTSKWANAMTEDGSLWVWIPRYAYKITSGYHSSSVGSIDVVFLVGSTNKDKDGKIYSTTYDMTKATSLGYMTDYVVHPVFGSNLDQGGWNENITGFWVAKFEAGYSGTLGDSTSAKSSIVKYTSNLDKDLLTERNNFYGAIEPDETYMTYPVFQPDKYTYVYLSVGDAYGIAKSLNTTGNPYGLSNNCNTHLMKSSEWGAVAYLTQSKYGRNGTEVSLNNLYISSGNVLKSGNSYFCRKTGYSSGTNTGTISNASSEYAYNSDNGVLASSTGNVYGIYDLSGGVFEFVSAYEEKYDTAADYINEYGSYLISEDELKYKSIISFDSTQTTQASAYATHNNIFGDAIWETSPVGNVNDKSWNDDTSWFPYDIYPFLIRGDCSNGDSLAGVFSFDCTTGFLESYCGYRASIICINDYLN